MNRHIRTVVIAPMTSRGNEYPCRIGLTFRGRKGQVVLDRLRTVSKARLVKKLGAVSETAAKAISRKLVEIFAY